MEIKKILEDLAQLEKDSKTLQEIKKIMHNDGTISIIDQITHLQENTEPKNINNIYSKLVEIENWVDDISTEWENNSRDVQDAIDCLNNVDEYSNYIDDVVSELSQLRDSLEEETTETEIDMPKETTEESAMSEDSSFNVVDYEKEVANKPTINVK